MDDATAQPPKPTLSKVPSWIMVGFVLGAMFGMGVQHRLAEREAAAAAKHALPARAEPLPTPPAPVASAPAHAALVEIENVFSRYEQHAVWRHDITEVALWRPDTNKYSEFFEVLRSGDRYYFRTIPHLTRPVVKPNVTPDLPLRFTEPEDEQLQRLREGGGAWLPPSTEP
jgi:hypothetical protein